MNERTKIAAKMPNSKKEKSVFHINKTALSQHPNSPIDHILYLQRTIGNQAVGRLFKSGLIQAKLKIGQPGDKYEQEADRVADAVMRMPGAETSARKIDRKVYPKMTQNNQKSWIQRKDESEQKLSSAMKEKMKEKADVSVAVGKKESSLKANATFSTDGKFKLNLGPAFNFSIFGLYAGARYNTKDWKGFFEFKIGDKLEGLTSELVVDDTGNLTLNLGHKFVLDLLTLSSKLSIGGEKPALTKSAKLKNLLGLEGLDVNASLKFGLGDRRFARAEAGVEYKLMEGSTTLPIPTMKIGFSTRYEIAPGERGTAMGFVYLSLTGSPSQESKQVIQRKPIVGTVDNPFERQADYGQLMCMPEPQVGRQVEEDEEDVQAKPISEQITPLFQRQEEEEEEPIQTKLLSVQHPSFIQRQVEEVEEEEPVQAKFATPEIPKIQRQEEPEEDEESIQTKKISGQSSEVTPEIASNINALREGGGQPLLKTVRDFFEPRFGYDFSDVRLHTDYHAAETAQVIKARAFTVGKNVVFGAGQYSPDTIKGKRLLAHELTHTIQQSQSSTFNSSNNNKLKRDQAQSFLNNYLTDQLKVENKQGINFIQRLVPSGGASTSASSHDIVSFTMTPGLIARELSPRGNVAGYNEGVEFEFRLGSNAIPSNFAIVQLVRGSMTYRDSTGSLQFVNVRLHGGVRPFRYSNWVVDSLNTNPEFGNSRTPPLTIGSGSTDWGDEPGISPGALGAELPVPTRFKVWFRTGIYRRPIPSTVSLFQSSRPTPVAEIRWAIHWRYQGSPPSIVNRPISPA